MADTFPTSPAASRAVRLGAIAIALGALLLAARTTVTSRAWVGRVFPGFLVRPDGIVASIGLAGWPGAAVAGLRGSRVVAVDGAAVASGADVYAHVGRVAPGAAVRYAVRR